MKVNLIYSQPKRNRIRSELLHLNSKSVLHKREQTDLRFITTRKLSMKVNALNGCNRTGKTSTSTKEIGDP